jgi:3-oxoacyl-[acyl-carrier protein] reductase
VPPGGEAARLVEELEAAGAAVAVVEADLADAAAPLAVLDEAAARLGRLPSVLVNNAAHSVNAGYASLDADTLDEHYAVNVRTPVLLSCELARRHPPGSAGRIVCLVSGQSHGPMLGELPYATTKGALETFVRQLAPEVMPLGITVNAVNPGVTDTGWIGDALRPRVLERMPAGRIGEPEGAARLVAWLCSPDARWVTGQVIGSEGGFVRA